MKKIIETSRLYLREFELSDARKMFELNSDKEVIKYTGDDHFTSESEALNFIKNYDHYKAHGFGRWAVILKETNTFIGWNGLKLNEENDIDIGFRFFKKYWGKGYATEIIAGFLEFCFDAFRLPSIMAQALKTNSASQRVLEKLGFEYVRDVTVQSIANLEPETDCEYRLTRERFKARL